MKKILINALDLAAVCAAAVLALWGLRGGFELWARVHPDSLVDAWEMTPVAFLWTIAWIPTILVCAVAVMLRVVTRGQGRRLLAVWRRVGRRAAATEGKTLVELPPRRGIATGVRSLDLALHGTGWRPGRLNGVWAVGMDRWVTTTLLLGSIATAQKCGLRCAWLGSSIDSQLAKRLDVDLSTLHVLPPDDEDPARLIEIAHGLAASLLDFGLVVIESVPPLHPGWDGTRDAVGGFARTLQKRGVACVYATHTGGPHNWDGPRPLRFYTSNLLVLVEDEGEASKGPIADARVSARVVKCSGQQPFNSATFDIVRDQGVTSDQLTPATLVSIGIELGVLEWPRRGIVVDDECIGVDSAAAERRLANDPELALDVQIAIRTRTEAVLDGPGIVLIR